MELFTGIIYIRDEENRSADEIFEELVVNGSTTTYTEEGEAITLVYDKSKVYIRDSIAEAPNNMKYITNNQTGTVSALLEPNKFYKFTNTSIISLNISFNNPKTGVLNEFLFEFTAGDVFASLNMPEGVVWLGGEAPTFTAGKTYQVSVVNNLAVIGEF